MKKLLTSWLVFVGISLSLIGDMCLMDTAGDVDREVAAVGQNSREGFIRWYIDKLGRIQKNGGIEFTPNANDNACCFAKFISCSADGQTVWVVFYTLWGMGAGSNLAISNDGGETFVTSKITDRIEAIALSKDGSVGYAALSDGGVKRFMNRKWESVCSFKEDGICMRHPKSIACSTDGGEVWLITKELCSNYNDDSTHSGETVWRSVDFGNNFVRIYPHDATNNPWASLECIAVSDDGNEVYVPGLKDNGSAYIMVLDKNGVETKQLPSSQAIDRIICLDGMIYYHPHRVSKDNRQGDIAQHI